jgi:hypothetical protein
MECGESRPGAVEVGASDGEPEGGADGTVVQRGTDRGPEDVVLGCGGRRLAMAAGQGVTTLGGESRRVGWSRSWASRVHGGGTGYRCLGQPTVRRRPRGESCPFDPFTQPNSTSLGGRAFRFRLCLGLALGVLQTWRPPALRKVNSYFLGTLFPGWSTPDVRGRPSSHVSRYARRSYSPISGTNFSVLCSTPGFAVTLGMRLHSQRNAF